MTEEQQDEAPASGAQGEVVFLLKRLQEQLTFLERKVDLLISQSKEKERERPAPAYDKERSYSKPSYGSPRPYNSERPSGAGRREGRYEGRSEGRPSYGNKSSYGHKSSGRPSYGNKSYGSSGAGFAGKKKPFFKK